ncbi:MAG: hypothetical protein ACOVRM_17205, partial [Planctomycetaceae bacterium]
MSRRATVILALSCFWTVGCQLVVPTMPAGVTELPVSAAELPVDRPAELAARAAADEAPSAQPQEHSDVPATATATATTTVTEISRLDLATALSLASGRSAEAAFAKARVEEAYGQLDRAKALKLPSLRAGLNYNKHEGRIQDVAGSVIETSRGSVYGGLGAGAVGAGSPAVPGVVAQFHIADAIFQPRIAELTVQARREGARSALNDALLAAGVGYMELLRAEQELAICDEVVGLVEQLEQTTDQFAKSGAGTAADHDRALTELALRRCEQLRAEEAAAAASARLAE